MNITSIDRSTNTFIVELHSDLDLLHLKIPKDLSYEEIDLSTIGNTYISSFISESMKIKYENILEQDKFNKKLNVRENGNPYFENIKEALNFQGIGVFNKIGDELFKLDGSATITSTSLASFAISNNMPINPVYILNNSSDIADVPLDSEDLVYLRDDNEGIGITIALKDVLNYIGEGGFSYPVQVQKAFTVLHNANFNNDTISRTVKKTFLDEGEPDSTYMYNVSINNITHVIEASFAVNSISDICILGFVEYYRGEDKVTVNGNSLKRPYLNSNSFISPIDGGVFNMNEHCNDVSEKTQRLVQEFNIKNCIVTVKAIIDNGNVYIHSVVNKLLNQRYFYNDVTLLKNIFGFVYNDQSIPSATTKMLFGIDSSLNRGGMYGSTIFTTGDTIQQCLDNF